MYRFRSERIASAREGAIRSRRDSSPVIAINPTVPLDQADIVLVRHGETDFNARDLLNGDPAVAVHLTAEGRAACVALAPTLGAIAWAATYVTRLGRTTESYRLMLPAGAEPTALADLDDIRLGVLESKPRAAYVEWRRTHAVTEAPAGGESRLHCLVRYARGMRWLAEEAPHPCLVVTHDQPLRYLLNALAGEDPILGPLKGVPNATPFSLAQPTVATGASRMESAARQLQA